MYACKSSEVLEGATTNHLLRVISEKGKGVALGIMGVIQRAFLLLFAILFIFGKIKC